MAEIGINLNSVSYWATNFPFIDRMKMAGAWTPQNNDNANPVGAVRFDANGYPIGMAENATNYYFGVPVDPPSAGTSRTYVLTWEGAANFSIPYGTIVSSEPGRIVFTTSNPGQIQIISVSGLDAAHQLSNMSMVREDQLDLFAAGEIFNPAFIDRIEPFSTIRFMDWMQTNNSHVRDWSDLTREGEYSWAHSRDGTEVPLSVMVALANKTKSNFWFNIPAEAPDALVREMATYIRDHLDPELTVHLEYSNEVWNWMFAQTGYSRDLGQELFRFDANGDGRIDPNDPAENAEGAASLYYGYRASQVSQIAHQVFQGTGEDRLKMVLATQTVHEGIAQYIFRGVELAGLGRADELFDSWAVTTYFGGEFAGKEEADRAKLLSWARGGAAGLDAAFQELMHGDQLEDYGSIDWLAGVMQKQGRLAAKHGLELVAYEGGFGVDPPPFSGQDLEDMLDLYRRMIEDPRMGTAVKAMVDVFAGAGGGLLNVFHDASEPGSFGLYGLMRSIYQATPGWSALAGFANGTDDVSTADSFYALNSRIANLSYTGNAAFTGSGNALANTIRGGDGGNTLLGRGGDDTLIGGAGNDLLDGGKGRDVMVGGAGDDVYIVDRADDRVVELDNGGVDEVRTSLSAYHLGRTVENLTYQGSDSFEGKGNRAENVVVGGDGDDRLVGYAGDDVLIGGAGNDVMNGGPGNDRMEGGAGDDNYTVADDGDLVVELMNEGHDTVRSQINAYALPDNVEDLIFRGTGDFAGTGNWSANKLVGGAGNDRLYGMANDDLLLGGAGDDWLDGGWDVDRMEGGTGDDTYVVDNVGDVVVEAADAGFDEVRTTLSVYSAPINVEAIRYIGNGVFTGLGTARADRITAGAGGSALFGYAGDDHLIGGAGEDRLDGGEGADRMEGGAGDDVYTVDAAGDTVVELAGGGRDRVRSFLTGYTLGANVEELTYLGNDAFTGRGNELDNLIEGNSGDDRLYGMAGSDRLYGGNGNDWLDGGEGGDAMFGGAGDDVYVVDSMSDAVTELAGQGYDEVRVSAPSYTLSANVEAMTFTGTGYFYGAGNDGDNAIRGGNGGNTLEGRGGSDRLFGGDGDDVLDGGAGADRMEGGLGDDVYYVDDEGDVVVDTGGRDTTYASVSHTLGAGVETLFLTGAAAVSGRGNALANTLIGNAAANVLQGMEGADTLRGGAGDDRLEGGADDDVLFGEAGNDVLVGGAGRDLLYGGAGADTFRFAPGDLGATRATADAIYDFSRGQGDRIDFSAFDRDPGTPAHEPFRFLGAGAFTGQAGEIRVDAVGGDWTIWGDTDGDRVADFALLVSADQPGPPVASDFVF